MKKNINLGNETLGQRLARLRKKRALTQCELAKIIGIAQSTLTDYERDKLRLHDNIIIKIAKALKISADQLLGLKNVENNNKSPSLKLMKRLYEIEKLSLSQQKVLLKNIDMFLKAANSE